MRNAVFSFLLIVSANYGFAQTAITGTVVNQDNTPLHYAFIQDKESNNATYTDSLGRFNLTAGASSHLLVSANGYLSQTVPVGGKSSFNITLQKDPSASSQAVTNEEVSKVEEAFKTSTAQQTGTSIGVMGYQTFTYSKETHGSRFLFTKWVHGYIVKTDGGIVQSPALLLNYDKVSGDLNMTEDRNSVMLGNKSSVKGFMLMSPADEPMIFELVANISADHYSQLLCSGSKYKIYKLIKSKFIASDYHTDGISSTGNQYDEYVDEANYYLQNVATNAFQPLQLKKKSLKQAFAADADKLTKFMAANDGEMDDAWVVGLCNAMNQ